MGSLWEPSIHPSPYYSKGWRSRVYLLALCALPIPPLWPSWHSGAVVRADAGSLN